ncbi:hypothetical protein AB0N09_34335 [Streptomyces erythrochromogenes]|uniref:hypothetical protein n=1 Tax=Streptomyces erythrochromogenes TaxID=285574 RepID=UPI00341F3C39
MADEPLVLEPADRQAELDTNTRWLSAGEEERGSLSVSEVVAAFERTAAALRARVRERGFAGAATFCVWHDEQAGQLRCSTVSAPPDALPFGGNHVTCDDLAPVVEGFLAENEPGFVDLAAPAGPDQVHSRTRETGTGAQGVPFAVWVSTVGASR